MSKGCISIIFTDAWLLVGFVQTPQVVAVTISQLAISPVKTFHVRVFPVSSQVQIFIPVPVWLSPELLCVQVDKTAPVEFCHIPADHDPEDNELGVFRVVNNLRPFMSVEV